MLSRRPCSGTLADNANSKNCTAAFRTFFKDTRFIAMKSTDRKARSGMNKFVITIFVIAIAIAAAYFFLLTPGTA